MATRELIINITFGYTTRISSTIKTITFTFIAITTTITIVTINAMTGATSVINAILLIDTGAATLESEVESNATIISITQTIRIRIIIP